MNTLDHIEAVKRVRSSTQKAEAEKWRLHWLNVLRQAQKQSDAPNEPTPHDASPAQAR